MSNGLQTVCQHGVQPCSAGINDIPLFREIVQSGHPKSQQIANASRVMALPREAFAKRSNIQMNLFENNFLNGLSGLGFGGNQSNRFNPTLGREGGDCRPRFAGDGFTP